MSINRIKIGLFGLLLSGNVFTAELAPPPYSIIDRNNVNMASAHVQVSQTTVSIGGNFGLSHTISSHSSEFVNYCCGRYGFHDRYYVGAYQARFESNNLRGLFYVKRTYQPGGTTDFRINGDGTYTPLRDPRYSLERINGVGLLLTTPDGTEVIYKSHENGGGSEIRYPNGFTISITPTLTTSEIISSVNTNTGFQLKYIYVDNTQPIDPSRTGSYDVPTDSLGWSRVVPKHVIVLNNAIEYCSRQPGTCQLQEDWPMATYEWPNGMPRAMHIGDSIFKVTDGIGKVTEYHHRAHDREQPGLHGHPRYVPRLVKIRDATSNIDLMNYTYINNHEVIARDDLQTVWRSKGDGIIRRAWVGDYSKTYNNFFRPMPGGHGMTNLLEMTSGAAGNLYQDISRTTFNVVTHGLVEVETWDKSIRFENVYVLDPALGEHIHRNRVTNVHNILGVGSVTFEYDSRGNVTRRIENGITTEAQYPANCNSNNRKYCNKAEWTSDGNGNKTHYTYHAQSGQVASVTRPADNNGIRPQTRYLYEQKYAHYKQSANGSPVQSDRPIWLLTEESYCIASHYNGSSCVGNDEVVTTYEYESHNLFMIGRAVTADGKTLKTCYRYDHYGNQIGKTQPSGVFSSGCSY